jgi:hypothetical protein
MPDHEHDDDHDHDDHGDHAHGHDHGIDDPSHSHNAPLSDLQLRVRALESLLTEKGPSIRRRSTSRSTPTTCRLRNGAQVVARA